MDLVTIPLQGFENLYTISETGEVHRIGYYDRSGDLITYDIPRLVTPHFSKNRLSFSICVNGRSTSRNLARAVYIHFRGKVSNTQKVVHIDGNIYNCDASNLKRVQLKKQL